MGSKKRKRASTKNKSRYGTGAPTLDDIRREAGPMGLLDPKLRQGMNGKPPSLKSVMG